MRISDWSSDVCSSDLLLLPEGFGHFQEWRSIAQSARLALNNCQIVPPVIDRLPRLLVRAVDNSVVLAQDLPLGRDDQPIGIDPQAHRSEESRPGKEGVHTVKARRDPTH